MKAELTILRNLRRNFKKYAESCLYIKTKDARTKLFQLNESQARLDKRIEDHKAKTGGKVRIAILKARQQGMSTYTEGRFFWRTSLNESMNTFILADNTSSASNIFSMVKRFYEKLPIGLVKPTLKKSNERALVFEGIDSSFRIGTAGAKEVGRSMTINNLHCSEVAFFKNANELVSGLFQTVPDNNESEIILESTANGIGGFFFDKVMQGLDPESEWETIFFPWFEHKEYSKNPPEDFVLSEEELEIKETYKLDNAQMYWRRAKIDTDFKNREWLFAQEYPASVMEAFVSTQNGLIQGKFIEKAKKCESLDEVAPVIMGVDPARNIDRTVITIRKGREIMKVYKYYEMNNVKLAGIIKRLIPKFKAVKCFIDVGCGYGVIDILQNDGYNRIVQGVAFNGGAHEKELYVNKRSEMFGTMRDWFMQDGWINIPDDEEISKELGILPDMIPNSNGQWAMPKKDEIKKENNGMSTDIADSIALTFAEKLGSNVGGSIIKRKGFKGYEKY